MRLDGVRAVAAYNWPKYLAGAGTAVLGGLLARRLPGPLRPAARAGAGLAATWILTSLAASWWIYDASPLYRWDWLRPLLPAHPSRYAVVTTGLDEIGPAMPRLAPDARGVVLDCFTPGVTTTGSIGRARTTGTALAARHAALPLATGGLDTVLAVFAAHELRRAADRDALFGEIARVLRPGGRLVLVEHPRDAATVAVFGPGAWHFYPTATWLRHAERAGLRRTDEARLTPFVRGWAFTR